MGNGKSARTEGIKIGKKASCSKKMLCLVKTCHIKNTFFVLAFTAVFQIWLFNKLKTTRKEKNKEITITINAIPTP